MEHYFSEKQSSEFKIKKIKVHAKNIEFELYSGSGVFSKDMLDAGSKLLIEKAKIKGNVLDIGCGYGAVGIAIKKLNPELNVILSDINERAIELAKLNAKKHSLNIAVIKSDIFSNIDAKFDTILLNPPQAAGKEVCFCMIKESSSHLKKSGFFELVARHNKGGSTYMKYMHEIFGNAKCIAKASGYRIYLSVKK